MMRTFSMPSPALLWGFLLVFVVGCLGWWLAQYIPSLGNVTLAILIGVLVGNALSSWKSIEVGAKFAEKEILPISIGLLGVELLLGSLLSLGPLAIAVIAVSITTAMLVSMRVGKWLGFSQSFSLMMGAGNAICGSSAVASTSLALKANESDTGIAIGVVNLLGTIGIFALPSLIGFLAMSHLEGGLLIGGTLQAFGQALAAGFSVSPESGQVATVVKMGRVLMLGPVVILLSLWMQSNAMPPLEDVQVRTPRFIFGFFAMSIIASLHVLPQEVITSIAMLGKFLLVVAMAGIGMRIQFRTLFRSGLKALLFGLIVSAIQVTVTVIVVLLLA